MFLLIMGPPGSGKGTQAKILADLYRIPHISSGDIFRQAMEANDDAGNKLAEAINKGQLVPDELTNEIVSRRLEKSDCGRGFILDGYPRTIAQGNALAEFLRRKDMNLDMVINLDVDEEIILSRLSQRMLCRNCGASYNLKSNPPVKTGICDRCTSALSIREDDSEETVLDRIRVYEEKTRPLIEFYEAKNLLCNIKGNVNVEEATRAIKACLERVTD